MTTERETTTNRHIHMKQQTIELTEEHQFWRIRSWHVGPRGGVKDGCKASEITGGGYEEAQSRAADLRRRGYGAEISPAYRSSLYEGRLK